MGRDGRFPHNRADTETRRLLLGEFPLPVVRIDCPRCERAGSYRLDGLKARFGADAALPDLLLALASCERRKDFSARINPPTPA
jgi:hypothetical protein